MIAPLHPIPRTHAPASGVRIRRRICNDLVPAAEDRQTPPTPEQLADDGRADGIPALTAGEFLSRFRTSQGERVARIRTLCAPAAKQCRTVVRYDADGRGVVATYPSLSDAARAAGGSTWNIKRAMRERHVFAGSRWAFAGETLPPRHRGCESNCKPVRCVETGRVYESAQAAARELGVRRSAIADILGMPGRTCKGVHWERV